MRFLLATLATFVVCTHETSAKKARRVTYNVEGEEPSRPELGIQNQEMPDVLYNDRISTPFDGYMKDLDSTEALVRQDPHFVANLAEYLDYIEGTRQLVIAKEVQRRYIRAAFEHPKKTEKAIFVSLAVNILQ